MKSAPVSSTSSAAARRGAGPLLHRPLGAAAVDGARLRTGLPGPVGVAAVVAALFLAFTACSALAAPGHVSRSGSRQHESSGGPTTIERAKGKSRNEEVIIIGHSKSGKREEVVIGGPKGSIGHVTATRGPAGGIGNVTVTGPSGS
jgi:hypothetical protein